jgi:hypothetical protein
MPLKVLNENKEQCRLCGGACCKKIPGLFFPEDLGNDKEQIISNLLEMTERNEVKLVTEFGGIVVRPEQKTKDNFGRGLAPGFLAWFCSAI